MPHGHGLLGAGDQSEKEQKNVARTGIRTQASEERGT
jgi:hypothetical protein